MNTPKFYFLGLNFEERRVVSLFLGIVIAVAFVVRVGAAVRSPNIDYADETYETREPAHHIAFSGPWVQSWEYRVGARSWVFPGFLAAIMKATRWMGPGSYGYLLGIVLVLSLFSLTAVWFSFAWAYRISGPVAAIIAVCCCAFWFELAYYAPKALNEVFATHLLLPALYIGAVERTSNAPRASRLLFAGLLCGLAVALRMQLLPAAVCAGIYFCWYHWRKSALHFGSGFLAPILCFGVVDALTWGQFFHSYIANYSFNIFKNKAILAGVRPRFWLFFQLFRHAGPVPLLALVGVRRSPFLGMIALAVLVPHSFIQHKEYRFIYVVVPIMITLAAIGLAEIVPALMSRFRMRQTPTATILLSLAFMGLVSGAYWVLSPKWKLDSGGLVAFQELSRDTGVCGVAIVRDNWWDYGGYAYLNQNVPIYLMQNGDEFGRSAASFNIAVTSREFSQAGFERVRCAYGVCTYRRAGTCLPSGANEINAVLISLDE